MVIDSTARVPPPTAFQHRRIAANFAQLFVEHRAVFDPVPIGVNDRVIEPGLDLRGVQVGAHAAAPIEDESSDCDGKARPEPRQEVVALAYFAALPS
jgi:hypothetical protein